MAKTHVSKKKKLVQTNIVPTKSVITKIVPTKIIPNKKLLPDQIIEKIYSNLDNPSAYSSIDRIYKEAHRLNKDIKKEDVRNELERNVAFSLHKPHRKKFNRLKTIPLGFMTDMQADLADFQQTSSQNDGYRYILVCVDVLSRKLFAAPVHSKSPKDMIPAFNMILNDLEAPPLHLFTDKGLEFQANEMKRYYKKHGILKYVAQSEDVKAAVAENFIRTLKRRIYKYFTDKETLRWIDVLPRIVRGINYSVNRITGMRPVDVTKENADILWNRLYVNIPNITATRYKEGDTVRIDESKNPFAKGYLPNYTREVFRIKRVKSGKVPNYRLEDLNGEEILGKFYDQNLSKYTYDEEEWEQITKIHDHRYVGKDKKLEYLVTFKSRPNKKQWVSADIIE